MENIEPHLSELRDRTKHVLIVFFVFSSVSLYFSGLALEMFQADLEITLNVLSPYEIVYARFLISVVSGLVFTIPVAGLQIISFAKPGLTDKEYRMLRNYLPISFILLILGMLFTYEYVFKIALDLLTMYSDSSGVEIVWGLSTTIGFGLKLSLIIGLMFQVPIIMYILHKLDFVSIQKLRKYRYWFSLTVLFLSALATPPDVFTQIMVSIPVIMLYELGILIIRIEKYISSE